MIEEQSVYEFDEFRVDVRKRQLTREGEVVPLYSKAFELLLVLLQNSGQVLSKEELLERVWPDQILEEANLPVNISAIRRALGEKASQPRFIITIPGRGYRFVADLNQAPDLVIESETIAQITIDEPTPRLPTPRLNGPRHDETALTVQPNASVVAGAQVTRPSHWRNRYFLAGVVITLLGIVGAAAYMVHRTRRDRIAAGRFTNVKATPITNNGRIGNAAVSPDGKFFAYARSERGKDRGQTGIYLSQMNGEKVIELVPPGDAIVNSLEYASDGSSLFYSRQEPGGSNSALYHISALGGVPLKLRENISGEFSLSPDNSRVAFLREDPVNKTRSLIISSIDGTNEKTLLTSPASSLSLRAVAWSPDGSRIAIGMRADETARPLRIMLVQADNAHAEALTSAVWRDITRMVWVKDGSGLLIIAAQSSPEESRQVWFVSVPHGETRHVTNDASLYDRGLTVSADPNKFLVVQLKQQNNIWIGNNGDFAGAKQITFATFNLANGNFAFDWLPDNRIVYASSLGQGLSLWTMDAGGGAVKEITAPGHFDGLPAATADGRFVVFASNRSGADEIWRVDTDGANPKQLTNCGHNSQPAVSHDGKSVFYISSCEGPGTLWRISIDGDQPVRLTDRPASWPWVSPDGKLIACGYQTTPDKLQLAVLPIEGGEPLKLFDVPPYAAFNFAVRWTPDGSAITYRDWVWGLWRQQFAGGAAERINGVPEDKIYCYGWSRDGKLFAFSRGIEIRDLVLMSNAQ